MGLSVSAATAIIVAGMFVAFGALYPVASNGFDRVTDANRDVHDRHLDRQNTAVSLVNATYDDSNETVTIDVDNNGATSLSIERTSVLVDNTHVVFSASDTVVFEQGSNASSTAENGSTSLWLPGETLRITVEYTDPNRVVVVTEHGVRDAGSVGDR